MMTSFTKYLIRGALTLLPLILTIYPLYYFFVWTDKIAKNLFAPIIPVYEYIPGTGMVLGILMLFLLGVLMSSKLAQQAYTIIEVPFRNIPMIKSVYSALKELANYLAPADEDESTVSNVVLVKIPGLEAEMLGFVMRSDMDDLPDEINKLNRSVVYVPMSYQIGGFTLFLPNEWLKPINMPVDTAMKNTLTGWITREEEPGFHFGKAGDDDKDKPDDQAPNRPSAYS